MIYTTLFLIGLIGLGAQALLGLGGHGHASHSHAHAGHGGHGHQQATHGRGPGAGGRIGDLLLSLLSPLTVFSLCLGVGAVGLLLRDVRLPRSEHLALALLGGLAFYAIMVRPLWNLVFRFASDPAKALEGAVAETAEALTRFDAGGKGLVRVTVDGQIVRILAYLEADDRPDAGSVQPGDRLTITSVDGHANTCRVARM